MELTDMSRTHHHSRKHGERKGMRINYSATPGHWVTTFMTRPRRRQDATLIRHVMAGDVDADNAAFHLGSRKPHVYYW